MNLTKKRYLPIIILSLSFHTLYPQEKDTGHEIEEVLISIDEENQIERTADELAVTLEELTRNPVNINTAEREELEKIFFLNEFQITSVIDYRKKHGAFLSIYELNFVFGFNRREAEKILPYIYIEDQYYPAKNKKINHLLINKTEFNNSYDKINENLPVKLYSRYSYEKNYVKAGLTMENDPCEDLFKNSNNKGFDYYSTYLEYKPENKWINNVIFGDYSASFGQGLNIWSKYSISKSIGSVNDIRKRRQGFRPYTSSNESLYFRGIASSFKLKYVDLNIFYSSKNVDASIKQDSSGSYFSSVQQTGYHRTNTEIENEKSVHEELKGFNVCFNKEWYKAGITYHQVIFSKPLIIENRHDKQFIPSGKEFEALSADVSFFLKQVILFSELSISGNKKQAWLAGANINLPYSTGLSLLYRNYDRGYYSLYSQAFGESSEVRNEKGFYIGIVNTSIPKLTIKGFADHYEFPWLTYTTDAPSYGSEYALLSEYLFNENIVLSLKLRTENKEKSIIAEDQENFPKNERYQKNSFRAQITYQLSENVIFKNRLETSTYHFTSTKEKGFLMYHDTKYIFSEFPLTLYGRLSIFETESFDTRIYQYENDLRYSFYIPFLNGKGTKFYLMFKYETERFLDIYMKTEYINYVDRKGVFIIKGQLVWRF